MKKTILGFSVEKKPFIAAKRIATTKRFTTAKRFTTTKRFAMEKDISRCYEGKMFEIPVSGSPR